MKEFLEISSLGSFIDNQFIANPTAKPISLKSCVTQTVWKTLHLASDKQIQKAIECSEKAFLSFRKTTSYERGAILAKVGSLLLDNLHEMARIITTEMGKTIQDAMKEIEYAAQYFTWFSHETKRVLGYEVPSQDKHKTLRVHFEPVGPCAMITPWNFPIAMPARKIASAIAAGCSVIVKPSPETPISMLALAYLFRKAHLPSCVLQVLVGEETLIGKNLTQSPIIRKISFTGSTKTGKLLYAQSAPTLKKITLELGGNAPFIVLDDADIQTSVDACISAKFRSQGQTCIAANRIFVHKKRVNAFTQLFLKKIQKLKIGNPFLLTSDLSFVLHPLSLKKMKRHLQDGLKKKGKLILKGKTLAHPHVMLDCTKNMHLFREESFSPLAAIFTFDQDKEAIELANATPFGLAAYLFTKNLTRSKYISDHLEFGMIGLNDGLFSTHQIPFGGVKASGFGREGGPYGIYEYLVEKLISTKY